MTYDHPRDVHLGSIHAGAWSRTATWLENIKRYSSIRFFGFARGRFFVGVVLGAKSRSKIHVLEDRILELNRENVALRLKLHNLQPQTPGNPAIEIAAQRAAEYRYVPKPVERKP